MTAETDAARIAELEQDIGRLRRLLDGRDAPGELRHRLRSTLALLRTIVRRSAGTARDLAGYVAHLEDRLDAIARAQAQADRHGEVGLHQVLVDELFHYGVSEGERLTLSGPDVWLQPTAGQVVALALHELAVNAVEHGALGGDDGRVEVSWVVAPGTVAPGNVVSGIVAAGEPDATLVLTWMERNLPVDADTGSRGFGTEVLTRMLAYDLRAETEFAFQPGELQCTTRIPLPVRVGRVASG